MARRSQAREPAPAPAPVQEPLVATNPGRDVTPIETRSLAPVGRADPDVKKPTEVTAAASRADDIWRQVYGQNQGDQGSPEGADQGESDQGAPDGTILEGSQQLQTDFREQERNEPGDEQDAPAERGAPDTWEHRYNSMRGRYDAEREQTRQLQARLARLEQYVQQQPRPQPQPPQPSQRKPLVSPEEVNEYGADFLDVVGRQARENITPELQQVRGELNQLRQQVGQVGTQIAMTARQRMEAELDDTLPEWRDINMEQDFLDWLSLQDPYSGGNRHQLLRQAFEQNQTPRVAAFFEGFLREVNASRPADRRPAPAQGRSDGAPPQPQRSLSQWAAPGRGRPAAAPNEPSAGSKQIISRDDISRFYNDVRAGRYAGRAAEKAQAEQEIMAAQREGRII